MRNNVSSTSLKSLLESYDRDAAASGRKKISTAGSTGVSGMKSSASTLASAIPEKTVVPEISAADAKSLMNAYYKPILHEAKEAAAAEKKAQAEAKKAIKKKSSSISIDDPNADGTADDFWSNTGKSDNKNNSAKPGNNSNSKPEKEDDKEKKPGLLARAGNAIKNGAVNIWNSMKETANERQQQRIQEAENHKVNKADELDAARQAAAQNNSDLIQKKNLTQNDKNIIFQRYNNFIQQGDNRKIVDTLNELDSIQNDLQSEVSGAGYNRAELEATLDEFTPEQIEQAKEYRDMYARIPGYRVADRTVNTALGTAKTASSGVLMAKDSWEQHVNDSSVNWENDQLQGNKKELENINAQIQEMQNLGNAYVMDANGSIADENGNIAYTPEFESLLNRKKEIESQIKEGTVENPVSKDTAGYKLYQSAQEDLARSDIGLSDTAKFLKGAATSAAENLAIAAVSPAAVVPVLSVQGAASSMGEDIANETPAGTTLAKGAAKFMAGWAINSVGVEQMLDTMGASGTRNTIAAQIVQSIKNNSKLAQTNPAFYAVLMGAGDNGLQSFAEFWADRAIDLASNTAHPMSMEDLLSQSISEAASGALGGAMTAVAGLGVNAGRRAMNNAQNTQSAHPAQYAAETGNMNATGDSSSQVEQTANEDLLTYGLLENQSVDTNAMVQPANDYDFLLPDGWDYENSQPLAEERGQLDYGEPVRNIANPNTLDNEEIAWNEQRVNDFLTDFGSLSNEEKLAELGNLGIMNDLIHNENELNDVMELLESGASGAYINEYIAQNATDSEKIQFITGKTVRSGVGKALLSLLRDSGSMTNEEFSKAAYDIAEQVEPRSNYHSMNSRYKHQWDDVTWRYAVDTIVSKISQMAGRGDGGYGANTVGAAESKFDNEIPDTVPSQSHGIQQALMDGGLSKTEAETATEDFTHEQIPIKKQTERAHQIINETGMSNVVDEYTDIVDRGGVLNDEQSDTAVVAIEELQKTAMDESASETDRKEAAIMRDRLMKSVSANNTSMARALGYQGNRVKKGVDFATAAHGAIDKIADQAIERKGGAKLVEETSSKIRQAVDTARNEAADSVVPEIENQIAEAEAQEQEALGRLDDARSRMKASDRSAKAAERAADRAEARAKDRVAKAWEKAANYSLQKGSPEEQLAKKVVSNSKDKTGNSGNAVTRMVQELFNLSKETAPQGKKTSVKYTPFQMLNEILFNRQSANETLQKAKEIVKNSLPESEQEQFGKWFDTDTSIGETVSKEAVAKAITQAIMETDGTAKELANKMAFSEYSDVVDEVTNYILDNSGVSESRNQILDSLDQSEAIEPVTADGQFARKNLAEIEQQAAFIRDVVDSTLSDYVGGDYYAATGKAAERTVLSLIKSGEINLREEVKRVRGNISGLQKSITDILVAKYGITEASAKKAADTVANVYGNLVEKAIDKNMRQMLPELYKTQTKKAANTKSGVDKFIEVAKMGQYSNADVKELIAQKWGIPGLTAEQTNRIVQLGDEMYLMKEKNSKAYYDKAGEMTDIISEAMGSGTWADAIASWPYVSMLSSIGKTGGKNVVGNVTLGGMTKLKNATVKPFLEWAAHGLSGGKYERTTANMLLNSKAQQQRSAAYKALIENYYGLLKNPGKLNTTGALINGNTNDVVRNAQNQRKIFADKAGILGKAAQRLADVENAVYGAQDDYGAIGTLEIFSILPENSRIRQMAENFMNSHYENRASKGKIGISGTQNQFVDAMSREMAAHGVESYEQLMQNRELADQMAKRAAQQANEATLHDTNSFTRAVMDISNRGGIVGKALNPFAKTGGNIVVRGAEYSPLGVVEAVHKARTGDAATAIDALSKSITGSALMALGAYAFKAGLITLKADDGDKDKYEGATQGKQKYSIEIGDFLRDIGVDAPDTVSASLDSLSVGAMPFFMGAGIADGMEDDNKAAVIGNSMLSLWDPLADLTLLSGITDLIQSIQNTNDSNSAVGVSVENIILGYLGEYIPTIAKQVGRSVGHETRKSYYSDQKDQLLRAIDFDLTGMKNWIPGLEGEDYIDPLGRTQESVGGNLLGRLAYNTLSPVTINYSRPSEVDDFLDAVYQQTKKDSVYPDMPTKHATVEVWDGDEKESRRLSKSEMTEFGKSSGSATEEMLKSLQDIDGILDIGGDNIANIQSDLYSVARNIGYRDALGDSYAGGESDEMKANMKAYDELGVDGFVSYIAGKKAFNAISKSDNPAETAELYSGILDELTPAMVDTYMSDDYKKPYQAYKDGGVKAMAAYERAGDIHKEIKDNGGKYADAVLSLDDMTPAEQGYIYALHSGKDDKAANLRKYYSQDRANKLAYWFMRYSAANLPDGKEATRNAWANKYISNAWEREQFLYLYKTPRKDWKFK